jgi:centractin
VNRNQVLSLIHCKFKLVNANIFCSVGRPRYQKVMITQNESEIFIGEQAEKYKGILKLNYPIEHGIIQDWDDMEAIWGHIFDELKVSPKEHPILLTEPPLNPYSNRIKMADIFFNKFGAPKIFFQQQAVLSLYARGKTSGLVLDCGDGVCHVSPVFEGFSINNAIMRIDLGGRDVTKHLQGLLRRSGYTFHTTTEFEIVKKIKELQCYVSVPLSSEMDTKFKEKEDKNFSAYHLPDGQVI